MLLPELNLTLANLRSAEFGFFGFMVPTRRHTPFISGRFLSAGDVPRRAFCGFRQPLRTWLRVVRRGGEVLNGREVGRKGDG